MKSFKLKIVTPRGIYYEGEVEIVNVRSIVGQLGILADYAPLTTVLEIDEMNFLEQGERKEFALSGGFLYVDETGATIAANSIESKEEIDLERAIKEKERVKKLLRKKVDQIDLMKAEVTLRKSLLRISVKKGSDKY